MITYNKTIEEPRLKIQYDEDAESPREWSNLGFFITCESGQYSPDKHEYMERIVKQEGEEAESQEDHIERIKKAIENELEQGKVLAIYPITKYEHGGVSYSLGDKFGFDYSNNGFYIITEESQKETGTDKKDFEKVINFELEDYNKWVNGEIYRFTLYDKDGEIEDSCSGFYDIEDIREYLPKEFKNEDLNDYLIN